MNTTTVSQPQQIETTLQRIETPKHYATLYKRYPTLLDFRVDKDGNTTAVRANREGHRLTIIGIRGQGMQYEEEVDET